MEQYFNPSETRMVQKRSVYTAAMAAQRKSMLEVRKGVEAEFVRLNVVKRVDARGNVVDYMVKNHVGGAVGFKTYADAAGYCLAVLKAKNPAMYANDEDEQDRANAEMASHVNHGTLAAIDDETSNADPRLAEQARRKIDQANKSQRRVR